MEQGVLGPLEARSISGRFNMAGEKREQLLDPIDRISEILFGLIMAVTVVGSMSIASAGHEQVHTATIAAIGCNLAWGLVDAVMYLVGTVTERTRNRVIAKQVIGTEVQTAHRLITEALPPHIAAIVGSDEVEGMRRRLLALRFEGRSLLGPRDYAEAFGIFLLVVIATFPVVLPFLLIGDPIRAMHASRAVTVVMLFFAGFALGRSAGHAKPLRTGLAMAVLGVALIVVVMKLGG